MGRYHITRYKKYNSLYNDRQQRPPKLCQIGKRFLKINTFLKKWSSKFNMSTLWSAYYKTCSYTAALINKQRITNSENKFRRKSELKLKLTNVAGILYFFAFHSNDCRSHFHAKGPLKVPPRQQPPLTPKKYEWWIQNDTYLSPKFGSPYPVHK